MYERLKIRVIFLPCEDVIHTSNISDAGGESSWQDENVDNGGWT